MRSICSARSFNGRAAPWAAWWVENDPFALAPFLPIGRLIHAGRLHPPTRERAVSGRAAFAHIEKKASQVTEFKDLGLSSGLLAAVRKQGYETPTPIQVQAIPPVLAGHDLLGVAQTGTGKTAAFALPLLHRMLENRRRPSRGCCRVLVLSPTRAPAWPCSRGSTTCSRRSLRTTGRRT